MKASSQTWYTAFIDCDICHRMAPLRRFYSVTLTCVHRQLIQMLISRKRWPLVQKKSKTTSIDFYFCHWIERLRISYSVILTYILRSKLQFVGISFSFAFVSTSTAPAVELLLSCYIFAHFTVFSAHMVLWGVLCYVTINISK